MKAILFDNVALMKDATLLVNEKRAAYRALWDDLLERQSPLSSRTQSMEQADNFFFGTLEKQKKILHRLDSIEKDYDELLQVHLKEGWIWVLRLLPFIRAVVPSFTAIRARSFIEKWSEYTPGWP